MAKDVKINLTYNNEKSVFGGNSYKINFLVDGLEYSENFNYEYQNDYELIVAIKDTIANFLQEDDIKKLNIIKPENFKMTEECAEKLKGCRALTCLLKTSHNVSKNRFNAIHFTIGDLIKSEIFEEGSLVAKQLFIKERDLISVLPDICINYNMANWPYTRPIKIISHYYVLQKN